jgi:signal transduction histidine kinase
MPRFYRADKWLREGGSGIGLTIAGHLVKRIVDGFGRPSGSGKAAPLRLLSVEIGIL